MFRRLKFASMALMLAGVPAWADGPADVVGSSTVGLFYPAVFQEWSDAYGEDRSFSITGTGTGFGFYISSEAQVVMASRPIKDGELERLLAAGRPAPDSMRIGVDAPVFVGLHANLLNVTGDLAAAAICGDAIFWHELIPDVDETWLPAYQALEEGETLAPEDRWRIEIDLPEEGSGTRDTANKFIGGCDVRTDGVVRFVPECDECQINTVERDPDRLTFVGWGAFNNNRTRVNAAMINGFEPSPEAARLYLDTEGADGYFARFLYLYWNPELDWALSLAEFTGFPEVMGTGGILEGQGMITLAE